MKISVCIPFYNESDQVAETLESLIPVMDSIDYDYEIILIDDGSDDGTWEKLKSASGYKRINDRGFSGIVRAIGLSRNFGKEAAMSAGLSSSSGDAVIVMDADLQHPPEYIPHMISIWENNDVQIVEGVKKNRKNDSIIQRINAFLFYSIFKKLSGYDLMNASDFKLLDRKIVEEWKKLGEHDTFFRALSLWLGFKREKFFFEVSSRKKGSGKWSFKRLSKLSINAITSFSGIPLYLVTILGIIFIFISLILGVQTLARWIMGTAATGFTTVILLQLITGGTIMLSLGLIGIYISRIFNEVKGRPRYIISRKTDQD